VFKQLGDDIHQNDLEAVCGDKSAGICLLTKHKVWEDIRYLSAGNVLLEIPISLDLLFL